MLAEPDSTWSLHVWHPVFPVFPFEPRGVRLLPFLHLIINSFRDHHRSEGTGYPCFLFILFLRHCFPAGLFFSVARCNIAFFRPIPQEIDDKQVLVKHEDTSGSRRAGCSGSRLGMQRRGDKGGGRVEGSVRPDGAELGEQVDARLQGRRVAVERASAAEERQEAEQRQSNGAPACWR